METRRKERRREYMREYYQRPEVKERIRKYYQRPQVIQVIDCFNKSEPIAIDELCKRSGAGRGYVKKILSLFIELGIIQTQNETYWINPDNPMRFALDGYYQMKVDTL